MYGKIFLKGIGYYIFSELLCLFLVFSLGLIGNILFKALSIICCAAILICLTINFTINSHKEIKTKIGDSSAAPIVITGIAAGSANIVLYALLLISKIQLLPDGFFRIYKLLNAPVIGIINLISKDVLSSSLNPLDMVLLFIVALIPVITAVITYIFCRKGIVPEEFLFKN